MYRWRARAADGKTIGKCNTATHVVPVVIERNIVAEDAGSHDVVQLGKLNLSRALQELSVRLDQLHGLDVLGSGNVALVNSLHLFAMRIHSLAKKQRHRFDFKHSHLLHFDLHTHSFPYLQNRNRNRSAISDGIEREEAGESPIQ